MGSTRRRLALLSAAAACLLLMSWCRGPDVIYPAPPAPHADDFAPAEPPPSTIGAPIAVPLSSLMGLLEEAVPVTHGSLEDLHRTPGRDNVSVAYELEREPFRATFEGDVARLATTVHYRMRMTYHVPALPDPAGSCGTGDGPRPRLSVTLESPISMDESWSLRTEARIVEVRPLSQVEADACEVTFLSIDVTDQVVDGARDFLEDHLSAIDSLVAAVDTRTRFAEWWSTLERPVHLTDSLWLVMGPEAVRRGPVRGSGDSVTVDLALRARPRIVFGAKPDPQRRPLPPLDTGDVTSELNLLVDARAGYHAANRFLNARLAGHEADLDGRSVQVDSLRVYGIGAGRLALAVNVSGGLVGRLFLTGRPVIDPGTGVISVPDLELDVATRDVIFRAVSWLNEIRLRDYFREQARWPADPAVLWLTGWLRQGLNREISEDLRVAGSVRDLRIVGVHALREGMVVRVAASGSARLFVRH